MIYKNKIKYLPIFLEKLEEKEEENLQKIGFFQDIFNKNINSFKLFLFQLYIILIRYLIPILLVLILSTIGEGFSKYGITDVLLYANGCAILSAIYLSWKINNINSNTLYYFGVFYLIISILTRFDLNISIISLDRFLIHYAYLLPVYWLLGWIVKDIFIYLNFNQFYLEKNTNNFVLKVKKLRLINKIVLTFFLLLFTSFSILSFTTGTQILLKKYDIYEQYFEKGNQNEIQIQIK
uniref:hypothetical protein n=1 Tax=Aliarcobacter sp. TaxID=2321116 RepID=UPI0040482D40